MEFDEFSWFVGLFDGEGCYYRDGSHGIIEMAMTDEDTIAKASKFLGCSYKSIKVKGNRKPQWRLRVRGGLKRGKTYELLNKMMPHLSQRRQEIIKRVWSKTE